MSVTPSHPLPAAPSLEHLRNQAKALLRAARAQDPDAVKRIQASLAGASLPAGGPTLATAQFTIAREYGFPSWPRLKTYIDSISGDRLNRRRPISTDLEWFDDRAAGIVRSRGDAIPTTLAQIREFHPGFKTASDQEILAAEFSLDDARLAVAREHGFDSWRQFGRHLRGLASGETVEPFLLAFEAIKAGDNKKLEAILRQEPSLANAWGTNGNTLLNLSVSVKNPGAVDILLAAGADVNKANKYGWTALHQAAYSSQTDVAERLIKHGGSLTLSGRGDGGTPLVQALFWGHRTTADRLADHGVFPHNLRAAAGAGRLDLVESFFDRSGKLTSEAGRHRGFYRPHPGFPTWTPTDSPQEILDEALVYASRNGRLNVIPFLVDHGADVSGAPYIHTPLGAAVTRGRMNVMEWLVEHGADVRRASFLRGTVGLTPLHEAAACDRLEAVKYLLEHGADAADREGVFHATPVGWAHHHEHQEVLDYLLEHGTLDLSDAIRFDKLDRAREILAADPEAANRPLYDASKSTDEADAPPLPLYEAIRCNNLAAAALLLERGANPNPAIPVKALTPLGQALRENHQEIAALLRRHGARAAEGG